METKEKVLAAMKEAGEPLNVKLPNLLASIAKK